MYLRIACAFLASLAFAATHASDDRTGTISQHAAASPDGKEIIFAADFDGTARLWRSGLDGSHLRKVLPVTHGFRSLADSEPAWSPDGRQVAYTSYDGKVMDVWVMRADGRDPVRLTANAGNNTHPSWSPDAARLVFVSDRDGTNDIWLMNSDGSGQRKLVVSDDQENNPCFSPSGASVVFSRTTEAAAALVAVDVDGSRVTVITKGPYRDWAPSWGVRGILFTSDRDGSGRWKLWKVQPDGSGMARIGDVPGHDPSWLQDGSILFTDEDVSPAVAAVSVLAADGASKRVIVLREDHPGPVGK